MTDFVNYQCTRCFHSFQGPPGPVECINCGFKYVRNLDDTNVYETVEEKEGKEVAEECSAVQTEPMDDDCMDCPNPSCSG